MKNIIFKHALKNAYDHEGKASAGAVMNRVVGEKQELKKDMATLGKEVKKTVDEINKFGIEKIEKELKKIWPESFEKRDEERHDLPELPNAEVKKMIMRFAPNPSAPIHIGHARQALLNWFYRQKYKGKFILRFDDTDPRTKPPMKEAYDWIIEDLEWLGIIIDEIVYASDRFEIYYDYAKKLIEMEKAYICTCDVEKFRELKEKGKACPCRDLPIKEQLSRWKKMFSGYKEGEAVYRVKTNINDKNPALRDWPGFRIIDANHPRIKARVWPLLNFNSSIDDHLTGVTHIIRGIDLDFTEKQQRFLYEHFGWKYPETIVNGRLNVEGAEISKSALVEGMKKGIYTGWDDEKLVTIKALRKKGITPEGIKQLTWDLGLRKNPVTLTWANIEAAEKKSKKTPTFKE